jgi:molybdenum-dependent DNA-binding transcriptional regulator ModE
VRFTRWRRAHFFRVLEETGHVQMAAEAAGVSLGCIYRLRRVEAGFTEKMAAAVEKADRRLEAQEAGQSLGTVTSDCPGQQALVIRRGRGGRLRVMAAGRNWWTERHDALFFEHLRATGSVAASARAAGFTPKSAWNRRDRLPGFARAMEEAREDADLALEFQLSVEAQRGRGDDYRPDGAPRVSAEQAMRTLSFRENRRRGRHSPRRAKPPDMEAVAEKIERKVRAIRRHREGEP